MKTKMTLIAAVGLVIWRCNGSQNSNTRDKISGVYAREYSFKIVNPEKNEEIGMRTIRDTIFIVPREMGFQVSNKKWMMNDYDREGWRNTEHSEDRPFSTYNASLVEENVTLESDTPGLIPALYIDLSERTISKNIGIKQTYRKIK